MDSDEYVLVSDDEFDAPRDTMTRPTIADPLECSLHLDDLDPLDLVDELDQDLDLDDAIDKARQELEDLKLFGDLARQRDGPLQQSAQEDYDEETRRLELRWKSIKREARQTYTFAMKEANGHGSYIPPLYVLRSQVSLLETMFLTFQIYLKQIKLVDKQDADIVEYLQQELRPLLEQAQQREQQILEQVSLVAASNHVLYDQYLVECRRQETEIRALKALLPVDKDNHHKGGLEDNDDVTLDLSESENYDELLHGGDSSHSSISKQSFQFQSSIKSFADSWTTFCHEQPERLSSTKLRVSESLSSTKHRVSESLVHFAVEQLGKNIPGC
jgi:hypothetical protein